MNSFVEIQGCNRMKWTSSFLLATICCFYFTAYADDTVHRTKSWNAITMNGFLSDDKWLKYFLESQLRFVDVDTKFEAAYLEAGVGHQTLPNLTLWLGFRLEGTTDYHGGIARGAILWQQFNTDIYKTTNIKITDRTRLEEIQALAEHGLFLLFQQRFTFEIPIDSAAKYSFVAYENIYFQVNHPDWVTNKLLNQNRLFLGFKYSIDSVHSIYFGYINQYQFNEPDVMSNIISLRLDFNND